VGLRTKERIRIPNAWGQSSCLALDKVDNMSRAVSFPTSYHSWMVEYELVGFPILAGL
jgi:hypothetical protein